MAPHRIFLMCGYFPCRCRKKWNVFRVWCDVWWVCISTKWSRKEGSITSQLWCYSDTASSPGERRQAPGPSAMLCFRSQEMRFSLKWLNVKTLNWLIYIHQDIEINTTILFVWSLDSLWLAASWPRRMRKSKKPFMALKGYWAFYVCLEPVFSYLHENQGHWKKTQTFHFSQWWVLMSDLSSVRNAGYGGDDTGDRWAQHETITGINKTRGNYVCGGYNR